MQGDPNRAQELKWVTGASIDRAWQTTTGRPDVIIAVHDSGVKWNDGGFLVDLNNKTWLNRGELPVPDWGSLIPTTRMTETVMASSTSRTTAQTRKTS